MELGLEQHLDTNYAGRDTGVVYQDLLSDVTVAKEMYAFLGLTGELKRVKQDKVAKQLHQCRLEGVIFS